MTDIIIIVAAETGGRAKGNEYGMQIAVNKLYILSQGAKNY